MAGTVRIATLNTFALPGFIAPHATLRMAAIVERAAALDVDALAMQEVWTRHAETTLRRVGSDYGYLSPWRTGRATGGLMVLTRLGIVQSQFWRYSTRGLPQRLLHGDYYGRKGYALAVLDTGNGLLSLLTTHLHARYSRSDGHDEYRGIRAAQVAELAQGINRVAGPLVAIGDFNIREGDPEYEGLINATGLRDAAVDLDARQATASLWSRGGAGHQPGERIDFVFTRGPATATALELEFEMPVQLQGREIALSDHAGLIAHIQPHGTIASDTPPLPEAGEQLGRLIRAGEIEAARRQFRHRGSAFVLLLLTLAACRAGRRLLAGGMSVAALAQGVLAQRFVPAEIRALERVRRGFAIGDR